MKCVEAQELMEILWELQPDDPRLLRLREHAGTCRSCAMEYEMWEDMKHAPPAQLATPSARAEAVNRNVMDRIYRDFPIRVEENEKGRPVGRIVRKRLITWIAGFVALFGSSFLFFAMRGTRDSALPDKPPTGILPTGVAGIGSEASDALDMPSGSGIMDPLVAGMDPSQPQYWMVLSVLGVGLALYFLMKLNRSSRR